MNNSQLAELEDDIQQQLARTEEVVREEVSDPRRIYCDSLKTVKCKKLNAFFVIRTRILDQ